MKTEQNELVRALLAITTPPAVTILRLPAPAPEFESPVETIDGSLAEEEDCTRVGCACSHSRNHLSGFYTEAQLVQAREAGDVRWVESRQAYYEADATVGDDDGEFLHRDDAVCFNGSYYHNEDERVCCDGHGTWFLDGDEDYVYVDGSGYWPTDECHYCSAYAEWVHGEEDECSECTPQPGSGVVARYHNSPAETMFRGASPFLMGFEVEKNSVFGKCCEGDSVGEYSLFAGWELDGSCGVEGVTHCYDPLDPAVTALLLAHVEEARVILAEPAGADCGGHINLSSQDHTPRELLVEFKKYAPLWYALFRNRLNNAYCRQDKKIEDRGIKFSPGRCTSFGIEIRLPGRVINADHLLRRIRFTQATCRAIHEGWSFNRYIKECRPVLLKEAYNGDRKRYVKALRLARAFRVWMLDGVIHPNIAKYVH